MKSSDHLKVSRLTSPLSVAAVTKTYAKSRVLTDFSLDLHAGQIHGLLGPNGSGKTTGLHVITGILTQDAGSVTISGIPIAAPESRSLLGFAPDDLPLPLHLSAPEFLAFHDALRGRDDRIRAAELARVLGLDTAGSKRIGDFSHGMKRKIQLIAAIMHVPDVLVLDEPFRGLDPRTSEALRHVIKAVADSGTAVLIATHDMLRAERDCESVMILHEGATIATGAPAELLTHVAGSRDLEEVFLSLTGARKGPNGDAAHLRRLFDHI